VHTLAKRVINNVIHIREDGVIVRSHRTMKEGSIVRYAAYRLDMEAEEKELYTKYETTSP